jgi:hypothetical protein
MTNTLDYYENSQITAVKSFITFVPGATTLCTTTLSINNLNVTLSEQRFAVALCVIMLSVAFYLLLCWMSLCLVSWRRAASP